MVCSERMASVGGEVLTMEIKLPIKTKQDAISMYRDAFDKHANIKLAVVDLISCPTATTWPIGDIVAECKKHNVLVLIDGAHGPGHVTLNLNVLGENAWIFSWVLFTSGCFAREVARSCTFIQEIIDM